MNKKIYVIGSSGSGKTTLAKHLSKKLNIPHFDMDLIRFPLSGIKRSYQERAPLVEEISKTESWVAEGVYVEWTKPFLEKADQIIWLDIPLKVTFPRILKRFAYQKITGTDRYGFKNTFRLTRYLIRHHFPDPKLKDSTEDRDISRDIIKKALAKYNDKILILKSTKEVEIHLKNK